MYTLYSDHGCKKCDPMPPGSKQLKKAGRKSAKRS